MLVKVVLDQRSYAKAELPTLSQEGVVAQEVAEESAFSLEDLDEEPLLKVEELAALDGDGSSFDELNIRTNANEKLTEGKLAVKAEEELPGLPPLTPTPTAREDFSPLAVPEEKPAPSIAIPEIPEVHTFNPHTEENTAPSAEEKQSLSPQVEEPSTADKSSLFGTLKAGMFRKDEAKTTSEDATPDKITTGTPVASAKSFDERVEENSGIVERPADFVRKRKPISIPNIEADLPPTTYPTYTGKRRKPVAVDSTETLKKEEI